MKHIGLFEGIGGFSLAARWIGWETVAWCEWNEFGQKVLKHHFPKAEGFGDITKTDFTKYANTVDIVTGGFPCQPYSVAGKRKGKDDERHLWPEMLRAIREIKPRWVVGENVLGLVNWNGGLVFDEVQADLEAQGYEVQPYILPACAKNAPHRRDRVWFVAYSNQVGINATIPKDRIIKVEQPKEEIGSNPWGSFKLVNGFGYSDIGYYDGFKCEPTIISSNDGFPKRLFGITVSDFIDRSNEAYGNAIVPQVALEIFKAINKYEQL